MGLGMLILFRQSSLGGSNVLFLFVQDKFGISVGKSQLAIVIHSGNFIFLRFSTGVIIRP